jgi:hypothetical protein
MCECCPLPLRAFENRELRIVFGLKRDDVAEVGGNCIQRFITYILREV